jgi:hypothetical protein
MITVIIPFALALVGGAIYLISNNPKLVELGRLLFAAGIFAIAFSLSGYKFSL